MANEQVFRVSCKQRPINANLLVRKFAMIETKRLLLRPFEVADAENVHRLLYLDREVADGWTTASCALFDVRRRIEKVAVWRHVKGYGYLAVVRAEDSALIGLVGLRRYKPGSDTSYLVFADDADRVGQNPDLIEADLTCAFGREFWGQGYAGEACEAMLAYGIIQHGIARVVNAIDSENERAIGLVRRLGFHIEPNYWSGGGVLASIHSEDFRRLREARAIAQPSKATILAEFRRIPGVGQAIAEDMWSIGLRSVNDLRGSSPELLYKSLCAVQKTRVDRCMLYVFRCAVYHASNTDHDPEKLKWWYWKDTK